MKSNIWLMALVMAAAILSGCSTEDGEYTNKEADYSTTFMGNFEGSWYIYNDDTFGREDASTGFYNTLPSFDHYSSFIMAPDNYEELMQQIHGVVQLTADSIIISDMVSNLFAIIVDTYLHDGYRSQRCGSTGNTQYRSRVMQVGNSTATNYLSFEKADYTFQAYFGDTTYTLTVEMNDPGVCIINRENRSIVVEQRIKALRATGLPEGLLDNGETNFIVMFNEQHPVVVRFYSHF